MPKSRITKGVAVNLRLSESIVKLLDMYAENSGIIATRSDAIRDFLELARFGLTPQEMNDLVTETLNFLAVYKKFYQEEDHSIFKNFTESKPRYWALINKMIKIQDDLARIKLDLKCRSSQNYINRGKDLD